jgi:Sensors of blue-light using FAD
MSLIKMVYVSAATKPFTPADLRDLLLKARTFNSSVGISGLLLYHERSFFQILEGQEEQVTPLFAHIGKDKRHANVLLLSREQVKERNFGAWSMGFVDVDPRTTKLTGFLKLLEAKSSFLELQGDAKLVNRLIDGFQEGKWRQSIEQ